jgi:hypothetical protein
MMTCPWTFSLLEPNSDERYPGYIAHEGLRGDPWPLH